MGLKRYEEGLSTINASLEPQHILLFERIQRFYTGPDSYWQDPDDVDPTGSRACFGNAWWLPFPPSLVIDRPN